MTLRALWLASLILQPLLASFSLQPRDAAQAVSSLSGSREGRELSLQEWLSLVIYLWKNKGY